MFFKGTLVHILFLLASSPNLTTAYNKTISQDEYVASITKSLDNLLKGYDKSIRPNSPGIISPSAKKPMTVRIDMAIRSMGPISETDMTYSMDAYFRQTWQDERLQFNSSLQDTLSLGVSMLDKIWKPDTYFWNGQHSYLHTLTAPNQFVRLSEDGTVHFSQRLTIKAKCPMFLHKFPLDTQRCPLNIGSYAYGAHDMEFEWKRGHNHSIVAPLNMSLSQFRLRSIQLKRSWFYSHVDNFSSLTVHFEFQRQSGYFIINFYGPCTLIVILSWVAFWINREATADRIGLGVTSILTMTFLFLDCRSDLPRVHYPTALDVYLFICYLFIVASILEFSVVHSFTKYGTGDPDLAHYGYDDWADQKLKQKGGGLFRNLHLMTAQAQRNQQDARHDDTVPLSGRVYNVHDCIIKRNPRQNASLRHKPHTKVDKSHSLPASEETRIRSRSVGGAQPQRLHSIIFPPIPSVMTWYYKLIDYGKRKRHDPNDINSVSNIDRASRIGFPLLFTIVSILYWRTYLSLQDILEEDMT